MRNVIILIIKDIIIFSRDRVALLLTFFVPAVLILLFGYLFGPKSTAGGVAGARLLVVDEARDEGSAMIVNALDGEKSLRITTTFVGADGTALPLTREKALDMIREDGDTWRHALIIPKEYLRKNGFGMKLELVHDPRNSSEGNIVDGMVEKVVMTRGLPVLFKMMNRSADEHFGQGTIAGLRDDIADSVVKRFGISKSEAMNYVEAASGGEYSENWSDRNRQGGGFMENLISINRTQVFGKNKNYAVQNVGGWAVMFLLFSLNGMASALLIEKRYGLFVRLLSGPATRSQILLSKFAFMTMMGFVQIAVLMTFGHVFWHIFASAWQIPTLALVMICAAMACAAIGMTMASFCKTEAQTHGVSMLVILSICAIGGAMFPLWMMPNFVQDFLAPMTPVYWAMDGCFAVLWRDQGAAGVMKHCAVLLTYVAVLMPVALWRFRRSDLFR
jgi:ABC-2 type transport system permease protein